MRPRMTNKNVRKFVSIINHRCGHARCAELKEIVKKIIADTGASSPADMGKVMGVASKQLAGKADGKTISNIVKELLAG